TDRQDARAAVGSGGDRVAVCWSRRAGSCLARYSTSRGLTLDQRMPGQVGREVRFGRDGPDSRPTTTVRDAEGLVQVEVRHIAAEVAEPGETEQGVEVRAIDVDLAAGVVHGLADRRDLLLVHAVCRGVGDHERGKRLRVLGDLGAKVVEVDVAEVVAGHDDHAHPGENGRGRVRAVRTG